MTILVFYAVDNDFDWERHTFDELSDEQAFEMMWEERGSDDLHFYDVESRDYGSRILNGDEFEMDYNDELLDGGWWVKVLHVSPEFFNQITTER